MSYEGRIQFLCANGHYHEENDLTGYGIQTEQCPHCHAPFSWKNDIDDCGEGEIDLAPYLQIPAKVETCNLGHQHIIEPDVFAFPQNYGHRIQEEKSPS